MVKKVWCDRDRNKCYTMLSIDWKVKNVWRCGVKTWDSSGSLKLLVWSLTEQRTQSCSSEWIPIKYHVFFSFDCFNVFPFLHCFLWNKNQKGLIPNRGKHLPFNLLFILHHYNYYIFKSFFSPKKSEWSCLHFISTFIQSFTTRNWRKGALLQGVLMMGSWNSWGASSLNSIPTSIKVSGILPKRLLASTWSTCYEVMCVVKTFTCKKDRSLFIFSHCQEV